MSKQNDAPDAWQGVEGDDLNTNSQGGVLIMLKSTTNAERNATAVAEALAAIDRPGPRCVEFVPGEVFYQEPREVLVLPIEQVHRVEVFGVTHLMRLIDGQGRDVECAPEHWIEYLRGIDPADVRSWRRALNGAIRVGELLAFSYGGYEVAREFTYEGNRVVELGVAA